ncbi:MAG: fibrobacter succinogenes major paralogous domain-containing protein [Crocinitomicaceae bacterium]|nr:fibrobacter succinogenes major paralogous domain-containing protein [Crocinitomicaceae bacterium]
MKKIKYILYFLLFIFTITSCAKDQVRVKKVPSLYSNVSDIRNNTYRAVKIGDFTWMVDNYKCDRYNYIPPKTNYYDTIRTLLPYDISIVDRIDAPKDTNALQWPYDGKDSNLVNYGRMYTWLVVSDPRNMCPNGWHVSTEAEWLNMIEFLGGKEFAGGKLKDTLNKFWETPNVGANNNSLFSGRAGGYRTEFGSYLNQMKFGYYWTSTEDPLDSESAICFALYSGSAKIYRDSKPKRYAMSVRCVKNH